MSYTKTVWQAHDIITAEKMQKIENQLETLSSSSASFAPTIANPQDGQTLVYNAQQQKWVNGAASSGSSGLVVQISGDTSKDDGYTFDKTAAEVFAIISAGGLVTVHFPDGNGMTNRYAIVISYSLSDYVEIVVLDRGNTYSFYCNTVEDYPYYSFD